MIKIPFYKGVTKITKSGIEKNDYFPVSVQLFNGAVLNGWNLI